MNKKPIFQGIDWEIWQRKCWLFNAYILWSPEPQLTSMYANRKIQRSNFASHYTWLYWWHLSRVEECSILFCVDSQVTSHFNFISLILMHRGISRDSMGSREDPWSSKGPPKDMREKIEKKDGAKRWHAYWCLFLSDCYALHRDRSSLCW